MNEAMLLTGRNKARPLIGYNADTGLSIGRRPINVTSFTPRLVDIQTTPAQMAGKSRVLRSNSAALTIDDYAAANLIGGGDFTLEIEFYVDASNENNYVPLLYFAHANGQLGMQLPDMGFGYRLQGFLDARSVAMCYAAPVTRSALRNGKFHHAALVRRNGLVYFYLDGAAQGLAKGTDQTNYGPYVADPTSITGTTSAAIFHAIDGDRVYCAGFALYDKAVYTANFTPKPIA